MYKNGALKKEWNSTICNNMDDPGGHHVKGNRPEGEKKKTTWSHYVQNLKQSDT